MASPEGAEVASAIVGSTPAPQELHTVTTSSPRLAEQRLVVLPQCITSSRQRSENVPNDNDADAGIKVASKGSLCTCSVVPKNV